jgi:uncharacterized repeat protein (TIGR01451 family)
MFIPYNIRNISKHALTIFVVLATVGIILVLSTKAFAQEAPMGLDIKIKHPQSGEYTDNIKAEEVTFLPGQEVEFQVEVKNNAAFDLQDVVVNNKLDANVEFISGPGNYDQNSHTIGWLEDRILKEETKQYYIKLKVTPKGTSQNDPNCVKNSVEAKKDSALVSDSTEFCFQNKVLSTVSELPKTGVSVFNILLLATVLSGMVALYSFIRSSRV